MGQECSYLAELVRINDTLIWSPDRTDSYLEAVRIIKDVIGARLAPSFLLDETGTRLDLVTDDEQRAILGDAFATMPASEHVREPWINPGEWPVSAADHLADEGWAILPDNFKEWFGTSGVVVSIRADGRHLGAVVLAFEGEFILTQTKKEFLAAAGRILGSALYRWQLGARERELGALEERRRLSDELHVDLAQQVATLGLHVGAMKLDLAQVDLDRLEEDVGQLDSTVTALKMSLRHQMLGLRSDCELIGGSFVERMRGHVANFERQLGIPVELECPRPGEADRVPLAVAAQLLRVLQEALSNAHMHSLASAVTVRLLPARTRIRLEVQDNGRGFDPDSVPDSRLGLRIMLERMQQIDGSVSIGPGPLGGTLVVAEAPLSGAGRSTTIPAHAGV
jgi:signal transduction histidine kinase